MGLLTPDRPALPTPSSRGRASVAKMEQLLERALVAAAIPVPAGRNGRNDLQRRLHQPWQEQALAFYDLSGVCATAADFYGKAFANLRFFPARRDDRGLVTEVTDEPEVLDLWNRVHDRSGGMTWIQRSYGRLQFLIGDGYLTMSGEEGGTELWEYLSPLELRWQGDSFIRVRAPGVREAQEALPANVPLATPISDNVIRAWRMYQPAPAYSLLAHSSMQPVLDDFEELVLLTAAVRARVKSRLSSAGILLIPDEITFPGEDDTGDEDPNRDVFLEKLMEHMTTPILQEGAASAVVPFILRAAQAYLDGIRHIKLHDPNETYRETGLRMETIKRIGISIDMPPEMLMGMGDLNHWVGWLIDEQWAKAHIFPGADMFSNDMASAYLRPACAENEVADWQQICVGYDPSQLVVHPDRSQNAKDLFDRGELGGQPLRKATGFTEADKPTEQEHQDFLAIKLRSPDLLVNQPENQPVAQDEQTGDQVDESAPNSDTAPATQPSMTVMRLIGAAEFTLTRARSLAGSRLLPRIRGCEDCMMIVKGIPNHAIASALGEDVQSLATITAQDLVKGAGDEFAMTARRWDVPFAAAREIGEQVEAYAARTLFVEEPDPLPPGFDLLVARTMEKA